MKHGLWTEKEAAEYLGLKASTLRRWRWAGIGPKFLKVGRRSVRYQFQELEHFASA